MAKALKTIGMVVGVVALVAATGGLALAPTAAAAAAGATGGIAGIASAATLASIGTIGSIAAGVIGVATAVFTPKPSFSQEGSATTFQTSPQSGLPYAIGRTRMSGLRIHADTYDATLYKSEGKQDALSFAIMLSAGGEIDSIESFRADKEPITFDPTTNMAIGTYSTWMAQKVWRGGQQIGDTALQIGFGGGNVPGWTTAHKLSGITHALWTLRYDPKGEKFGAGVPEPEWIGKWVKVYDPRKDSTYPGGSGSHRALNEATYEWSNNPALHALTWCLGRWQNGKRTLGIGAPVATIRIADFVEAANVADVNDWTCGGVEWSTDSKWSILKRMLQAGGAEPTMTGAMIGCRVNAPSVSIATVTGADLQDGLSFSSTRSRRDRFNTVIPRFRSEDHDWQVISGSPVSVPLYVSEDDGQRTKEIDFPLVQHEVGSDGNVQAGQLAAYEIVNSRQAGPIRFTTGPKFIGVKTGDVVTLDVPEETFDAQPVLIRSRSIDPATFKITFEAETALSAGEHDFALGKTTTPPPSYEPTPPDLTPPTPNAALWTLSAEAPGEITPSIVIAGVCEFPGADSVLMEYRKVGAPAWLTLGKADASAPVNHVVSALEGETAYQARVAYQSGSRVGPWLTLTSVTTAVNPIQVISDELDGIAGDIDDFDPDNNGNSLTPPAPTGVAITGTIFIDSTGQAKVTWNYTPSSDPNAAANIDGYIVLLLQRESSAGYTFNPADIGSMRRVVIDDPTVKVAYFNGTPVQLWDTAIVIPFRKVNFSVNAAGIVYGTPAQSSATTPYRMASAPRFNGMIAGLVDLSSSDVVAYSNRAAAAIRSDFMIDDDRVGRDAILADAISATDYVAQLGTTALGEADDATYNVIFGVEVDETGRLHTRLVLPYYLTKIGPTLGATYTLNVRIHLWDPISAGEIEQSPIYQFQERWDAASSGVVKNFEQRVAVIEHYFSGIEAMTYDVGYTAFTPFIGTTNEATLPPTRFLYARVPKADS